MPTTWSGAVVKTTSRANIRRDPSRSAPPVRVAESGETLAVSRATDTGEAVEGNRLWFELGDGTFVWSGATTGAGFQPGPPVDVVPAVGLITDEMGLADGAGEALVIDRTTFVLPPTQYVPESVDKDLIILHFTAGQSARSAFETWRRDAQRVGTAFVVDPDGTIYELFPPTQWAFHLGIAGTSRHDRRSIGIEIANVGPLKPSSADPNVLNWWPAQWGQRYCRRDEADRYIESPYRGMRFFARFPGVQMDAVGALVRQLCAEHGIPRTVAPAARRNEFDLGHFNSFSGVATHANFRADKWDIGPAFDWGRLQL
jgi:N-acetyl-anhydromuramyl-L-alanine amidase AmpD